MIWESEGKVRLINEKRLWVRAPSNLVPASTWVAHRCQQLGIQDDLPRPFHSVVPSLIVYPQSDQLERLQSYITISIRTNTKIVNRLLALPAETAIQRKFSSAC
jgi:hypothetical protein